MAQTQETMTETQDKTDEQQTKRHEKMCCEGGMTAAEHRAKSPNGRCCTD